MKRLIAYVTSAVLALFLFAEAVPHLGWGGGGAAAQAPPETYVIRNARIVPVTGPVIEGGSVVISNGRIAAVGRSVQTPAGAKVIDATGLSVYPGMINAGCAVGVMEILQVGATVDVSEMDNNNANIKIDVAINPASAHIPVTRVNGITTVLTQPRGGQIAGQSALVNLDGWTPQEMVLKSSAAMHVNWPNLFVGSGYNDAKRRNDQQIEGLKKVLRDAKAYGDAKDARAKDPSLPRQSADLKLEALIPVARGQMPIVIHASSARDIRNAIAFADDMKIKMIVSGGAEAYKVAGELRAKNIPVIVGPVMSMPREEDDRYDIAYANAGILSKAGVKVAFQTGDTLWEARNLPYHAGFSAGFGMPKEEALKAVTIYPAEIFGVADQVGSIEQGKIANLIVTDGDPLETLTKLKYLFIQGRQVPLSSKHTELYEKYKARP